MEKKNCDGRSLWKENVRVGFAWNDRDGGSLGVRIRQKLFTMLHSSVDYQRLKTCLKYFSGGCKSFNRTWRKTVYGQHVTKKLLALGWTDVPRYSDGDKFISGLSRRQVAGSIPTLSSGRVTGSYNAFVSSPPCRALRWSHRRFLLN